MRKQQVVSGSSNMVWRGESNKPTDSYEQTHVRWTADSSEEPQWCGWHNDHGTLTGLTSAGYFDADGNMVSAAAELQFARQHRS